MSEEKTYLVADIGGTNARFGIARGNSDQGFSLEQIQRFKNRDFKDLGEAALAYLADCTGSRPQRGCIAVAGPVGPGLIQLTNSTWQFEPDALARDLGLESLLPVNDFAAQADWSTYDDTPGDVALANFSIERDLRANGSLTLIKRALSAGFFISLTRSARRWPGPQS